MPSLEFKTIPSKGYSAIYRLDSYESWTFGTFANKEELVAKVLTWLHEWTSKHDSDGAIIDGTAHDFSREINAFLQM